MPGTLKTIERFEASMQAIAIMQRQQKRMAFVAGACTMETALSALKAEVAAPEVEMLDNVHTGLGAQDNFAILQAADVVRKETGGLRARRLR